MSPDTHLSSRPAALAPQSVWWWLWCTTAGCSLRRCRRAPLWRACCRSEVRAVPGMPWAAHGPARAAGWRHQLLLPAAACMTAACAPTLQLPDPTAFSPALSPACPAGLTPREAQVLVNSQVEGSTTAALRTGDIVELWCEPVVPVVVPPLLPVAAPAAAALPPRSPARLPAGAARGNVLPLGALKSRAATTAS